jgi:sporulation protein YlmC with PRC-barrel domain
VAEDDLERVVPMDRMEGFRVAEGDPDVRGWEVVDPDGRRVGRVDELLVDASAGKVRYLDVEVDRGIADGDRHVLVPIGYARLEREEERVRVDSVSADDFRGFPARSRGPVTRDFEAIVRDTFGRGRAVGTSAGATAGPDFYAADAYDENRFYGRSGESRRRSIEGEL